MTAQPKVSADTALSPEELHGIDACWRAANYLTVGQIYLLDNPLLREPLHLDHVKPRLLGHWGTSPGLNFIYAHLNRVIPAPGRGHGIVAAVTAGLGRRAPQRSPSASVHGQNSGSLRS